MCQECEMYISNFGYIGAKWLIVTITGPHIPAVSQTVTVQTGHHGRGRLRIFSRRTRRGMLHYRENEFGNLRLLVHKKQCFFVKSYRKYNFVKAKAFGLSVNARKNLANLKKSLQPYLETPSNSNPELSLGPASLLFHPAPESPIFLPASTHSQVPSSQSASPPASNQPASELTRLHPGSKSSRPHPAS